jgi:glutathione synthase/RimK-type ligase-like ATP-grasp enzyme
MHDHLSSATAEPVLIGPTVARYGGISLAETRTRANQMAVPTILLTATLRWPIAARLAVAFGRMGCRVEALAPHGHPVSHAHAVRRVHAYSDFRPVVSLGAAIEAAEPDLIVPCDDNAAVHLHRLYEESVGEADAGYGPRALIARSLGAPEACALATRRGELLALAAGEGVRIPVTAVVATRGALRDWLAQHGVPAVMKIDGSWGGLGVAIVRSLDEALHGFDLLAARPSIATAAKRALLDRDPALLLRALNGARRSVTLQKFVPGRPANRAVACWHGRVLAGISVEALETLHSTGPATVVRVIENAEMSGAVSRLARRLGISGLWGADFVLDSASGAAYLIEMNPRATPICHLPLGTGRDLPAALYAQLTGSPPAATAATIGHDVIALFPGEWHRNAASSHVRLDYHDVPWDEPELVRDGIEQPWAERGWLARLRARVRPKSARRSAMRETDTSAPI